MTHPTLKAPSAEAQLPWFSDAEINAMCHPLTRPTAQVKFLRTQGLHVTVRPNGRPLVMRMHAERVLSGLAALAPAANETPTSTAKPNSQALVLAFKKKAA